MYNVIYFKYTKLWISNNVISEWLLFNAKWANFRLYHDENKLITGWWNVDDDRFILDKYDG